MALSPGNYVKFIRGSSTAYQNLTTKDNDTLYFISDNNTTGKLYLGTKLISGGGSGDSTASITLADVQDVLFGDNLNTGHVLAYDAELEKWVNMSIEDALGDIVSTTKIYEATLNENENHDQALVRIVGDKELHNGDIAVIKELIASDKYQYTAYVYDGEKGIWVAMDGNYSAENVYFKEDLMTTTPVGVIELTNGQATITAAGKNLKEVFNTIFVKEENPITTDPSVTVSLPLAKAYEVGTTVKNINFTASFNDGAYSYGPEPTGAEVTAWSAESSTGEEFDMNTGSLSDLLVTDGIRFTVSATATHTEGNIPVTNTGNPYEAGKIEAGEKTGTSNAITGFRAYFYGADTSDDEINSDFIRTKLNNSGAAVSSVTLNWKAVDTPGIKRYIVAIPESSSKIVKKVIMPSSVNADATNDYILQSSTVEVEGADGYTSKPYKIWIYQPASIADNEEHKVTLG